MNVYSVFNWSKINVINGFVNQIKFNKNEFKQSCFNLKC